MFSNLPSLNSLKTFEAAARLKSFKHAAEELHVTPTAVSHQIKALEEALETLLFERKTRAVSLTTEGELLAATVFNIFQELAKTVNDITHSNDSLTVSTTSSFAALWLVPNLEKFYQLHPNIDISVKTGEQLDDVEHDRRIDIAIRYGTYDPKKPHRAKLITESIGMYATPDYLASISSLINARIIETRWGKKSFPPITWQALTANSGGVEDTENQSIRYFDQEHHAIQAALAGQGIALVSSLLVSSALNQGWLVPYTRETGHYAFEGLSYYLIMPPRSKRNKNVLLFSQWLSDEIERSVGISEVGE